MKNKGKLWVLGMGPGRREEMTLEALAVLERVEIICGYKVYNELLREDFPEKEYLSSGMRQELQRVEMALERAQAGAEIALVSSGDSGIYGLASLSLELAPRYPDVEIEIVPGLTAALTGAARLGAPLGHDSCLISLSDLLTPWELIEKRLEAAALGDFAIVLYNPASRKRPDYPKLATEILLKAAKAPETPCAAVRNIGREGEESWFFRLAELPEQELDMFCTVFIGNSQTQMIAGRMVTPRGYRHA